MVACRPLVRVVVAVGSYVVTTVVAWVLMGGSLGELPSWLRLSFEVAHTYSDAVAQENEPNTFSYLAIAVTLVAGLTLVVVAYRRLPALSLVVLVLGCLAILFLGFKEATTRHEFLRLSAFELGVPVFVLALHHWRGRTAAFLVLGLAVLVGNNSHVYLDSGKARLQWATAVEVIADPSYQRELLESARATGRDDYAVPPELLEEIGSRPLSVDGYEVALPWYYDKRWDAAPVLQSYTAYSEALDEADTDWLESRPDGHRILRPTSTGIDGRSSRGTRPATCSPSCRLARSVAPTRGCCWPRTPTAAPSRGPSTPGSSRPGGAGAAGWVGRPDRDGVVRGRLAEPAGPPWPARLQEPAPADRDGRRDDDVPPARERRPRVRSSPRSPKRSGGRRSSVVGPPIARSPSRSRDR